MAIDYSRSAFPPSSDEVWAPVPNAPMYEVSTLGRVRSWIQKGGPLCQRSTRRAVATLLRQHPRGKERKTDNPYLSVTLRGKSFAAHRLVLEAFVGPCPDGFQAAHLNGCRSDNRLVNLRWVSPQENAAHKHAHGTDMAATWQKHLDAFCRGESVNGAKLNAEAVREIRRMRAEKKWTCADIALKFGVSKQLVSFVALRKVWRHVD